MCVMFPYVGFIHSEAPRPGSKKTEVQILETLDAMENIPGGHKLFLSQLLALWP